MSTLEENPSCYGNHSIKTESMPLYCTPCGFKDGCKKEERSLSRKLINLRKAIHPEKPMDIIAQCEIVAEALQFGSPYEEAMSELAEYLGVSYNQVYKMNYIHENMIDSMKGWFRGTTYQCHTAYDRAAMPAESQHEFMVADDFIKKHRGTQT